MDMTPTRLAALAEISIPYASQLLTGARAPAMKTALGLWRKCGLKFGVIAGFDDDLVRQLDEADRERAGA